MNIGADPRSAHTPVIHNQFKHWSSKLARAEPMLKTTPQSLLQFDPLQGFNPLDHDAPPATWSGNWVSRRLVEGFKTLRLIPLKGMPSGFKNAWPPYMVEWEDTASSRQTTTCTLSASS
jgi:hypothetical protein